jgi:hypothetical protein
MVRWLAFSRRKFPRRSWEMAELQARRSASVVDITAASTAATAIPGRLRELRLHDLEKHLIGVGEVRNSSFPRDDEEHRREMRAL